MAGCFVASQVVKMFTGWPVIIGDFDPDPWDDAPDQLYGHAWNLMPDGRIFDATACQFGLPCPFVTDAENPLYQMDMVLP